MRSKQQPSPNTFFVGPEAVRRKDAMEQLHALGSVEKLEGAEGLLLHVDAEDQNPRAVWNKLRERLSGGGVLPVMLDETGELHLPTGEVTVRFTAPPSDEDLRLFAKAHGLELRQRNKYQPAQASFVVPDAEYLPDVIEAIQPEKNVAAAWANTKSRYRRS
jgi:hypothetical protein